MYIDKMKRTSLGVNKNERKLGGGGGKKKGRKNGRELNKTDSKH